MAKKIYAIMENGETVATCSTSAYQWDTGVQISLSGIPSDMIYSAQAAFDGQQAAVPAAVTVDPPNILITVPDVVLIRGKQVFVYLEVTDNEGVTVYYEIRLPVVARSKPVSYESTQEEETAIGQLIATAQELLDKIAKLTNIEATAQTGDELGVAANTIGGDTTSFDFTFPEPHVDLELSVADGQLEYTVDGGETQVAGRVRPRYTGEWNKTTSYEELDLADYDAITYLCKAAVAGVGEEDEALAPDADTEHWEVLIDHHIDMSSLAEYEERLLAIEEGITALEELLANSQAAAIQARIDALYEEINQRLDYLMECKLSTTAADGNVEKVLAVGKDNEIAPAGILINGDTGIVIRDEATNTPYEIYIYSGQLMCRKR